MFNSTHTLVGLLVAKTGLEKQCRYAAATAVIASNLPDIDSVAALWGTATYIEHHRGITHSLIGVPVLAFILSAAMYVFSGNFGRTFVIALIAMATHPALDYLNPYGVRPFLPWSDKWYYGDLVFIIDPYLDAVLLAGVIWASLKGSKKRFAAFASIVVALGYVFVRLEIHSIANRKLEQLARSTNSQAAVLPHMLTPFVWDGIIQSANYVTKFDVHPFLPSISPFDPLDMNYARMEDSSSPAVRQAETAASAQVLLRFARFPVSRVEEMSSGYRVTILDFRFYREDTDTALASEVILDRSLTVVKDDLSFVQRIH
jgi:inner membrane protein